MSLASSRIREREKRSVLSCTIEPVKISASSDDWYQTVKDEAEGCALRGMAVQNGTTIRISPMERKLGGWHDEHFNENLKVPIEDSGKGIVVTFEAMSRECVAIALSPLPSYQLGSTYVAHFGANGNMYTVIRRRLQLHGNCVEESINGRVCTDRSFQSYWMVHSEGIVSVGIGINPGKECIGSLNDSLYFQTRPGQDALRYVGIGNSVLGRWGRDIKVRNLVISSLPNEGIRISDPSTISLDEDDALSEYHLECEKARKRALKFEIDYVQPQPKQFLKWTEAKRRRANPEPGFITGIDTLSTDELERRKRRRQRFEDEGTPLPTKDDQDESKSNVPVEQAWDKEDLVSKFRVDPPQILWKNQPHDAPEVDIAETASIQCIPTKLHMFAIDWAAFKQIRTDDILSYFSEYGPKTHVEWLGELSCNVLFEDKYSATRALVSLSQEIPEPAEDHKTDFASMGWRFCLRPITKIKSDRFGKKGTFARMLLRETTSLDILDEKPSEEPASPPGFTTKKKLGPHSDIEPGQTKSKKKRRKRMNDEPESMDESNEIPGNDTLDPHEDHPGLERGLKSVRGGFSVEEMQRDREATAENIPKEMSEN